MKTRRIKLLFLTPFLIVLLFTLSNCNHYYYAPNSHNVPLFKDKGEARAMVAFSAGDEVEAMEFQGAYALTNHIGLMANGFYVNSETSSEYGKGPYIEFGSGYFRSLNDLFIVEGYGGAGWGKSRHLYGPTYHTPYDKMTASASFSKFFIQPSIGLTTPGFDIALSTKLSGVNFQKITHSSNLYEGIDYELAYLKNHKFSLLFEPALTIRGGWKHIKLQLQGGLSANLNNPDLAQEKVNISLGLYFTAGKWH